ncbi:unnamed protein product [Medioppia subpectinata]|uniref:Uncharacterized protein n=1 Tax=Medioppia subpectinata TaxID=1979941 RepID=A0A7R9KEM7_9ACAR|nr:unnamed protein product [Medioppia subpectinata]CAG2101985.1 unnamed protein product [Medioppia subpectinata]
MSWIAQIISIACIIFLANCAETHGDDRAGPKDSRGHYSVRRLDCSLFCKKTGFSGYVGGCQCGFTLFANKRSDANNIDTNG